jgi:hypothetical protein
MQTSGGGVGDAWRMGYLGSSNLSDHPLMAGALARRRDRFGKRVDLKRLL